VFGCDLLLLHAPSVFDFRKESILYGPISDVIPSTPVFEMYPVGFTSISEHLSSLGFSTRIINLAYRMLADPAYDAQAAVRRRRPRLAFGIDLHWLPHAHGAIEVARLCKKYHPEVPVILGGLASTYFHREIIEYDCVDYVIRGDSTERPFGMLMKALKTGGGFADIPNLTYKDASGRVFENPLTNVEVDLDSLTNNYLHMFRKGARYLDVRNMIPFHDWWSYPITAVMTCRGCTQDCGICGGSRSGYAGYCGRDRISFRSPERLAEDVRRIARYSNGPIFLIGDLRQGGESYAQSLLRLLRPHRIQNHMVLELFFGATPGYVEEIAATFANFNFEMSPETHDDRIRHAAGKPYTSNDVEESIRLALEHGAKKFDLYFMVGLTQQDADSVLASIDYCKEIMERFDSRLMPLISPLAPFLDPGSPAYENADQMGYEILFRSFEDHRRALLQPSWKYTLNYRTKWMDRDRIVSVTYEAGRRLNRLKGEMGFISREAAQDTERRIDLALRVNEQIDAVMNQTQEGPERDRRLKELKEKMEGASASTVCQADEIKWPVLLGRNLKFLNLARDILLGAKI